MRILKLRRARDSIMAMRQVRGISGFLNTRIAGFNHKGLAR